MLKIAYSFADKEALKIYLSEAYGLPFHRIDLFRDQRGTLYIAHTPQRKYVFKLSDAYYAEKSVNAVNLIDFLRKRGFPAVEIIPTSTGGLYITLPMPEGPRIGVLYEFIEGRPADYNDIEEIGKITARLHNEAAQYPGTLPNLYNKHLLIDELPKTMRSSHYNESKITEVERITDELWKQVKDFPPGIVHGDLDMGNIIIKHNGTVTLFDFDDAGRMPLIFDVACICNRISHKLFTKESVQQTKETTALFLKGYTAINPHAQFETSDILNWIALRRIDVQMISMRFLLAKRGSDNPFLFLDMFHKWVVDWNKRG